MTVVASAARRARYCETVTPPRSGVAEKGLQGDRRRDLAGLDEAGRDLVDAPVQLLEEMLRLEEVGDAVKGVVVDEDGPEKRLLGVDVVRRDPVFAASTASRRAMSALAGAIMGSV